MAWSTPIGDYQLRHGYRVATYGEALWHPRGERRFCYAELHIDDIVYNPVPWQPASESATGERPGPSRTWRAANPERMAGDG